jgi:hypothetical protein
MIPTFPAFTPISLTHKAELEAYLQAQPPQASEYTFTNLFAWRGVSGYQLCRFGAGFLIRKEHHGHLSFLQPLVPTDLPAALTACADYLRTAGHPPIIERVGEDALAQAGSLTGWDVREDRDNFDYVYRIDELVALSGPRFHDKKNLLTQFLNKNPSYQYRPLTADRLDECIRYAHDWCELRQCETVEGMSHENCAALQMLHHFSALSTVGGIIEVDEALVALTLGEALAPDTLVVHIEKADNRYTGLYQAIHWDFLRHAGTGYTFVNREQDLGIPGLRKAKLSYNPVHLVKKYVLTR